jgi:hypothetical protein
LIAGGDTPALSTESTGAMVNEQAVQPDSAGMDVRPKAIGLIRSDISRLDTPRHSTAIERHARELGLRHVYTVRPPQGHADPVGYALGIAAGLDVATIVIYDLAHVDDQPARVCEDFDLETVCPATTWARIRHSVTGTQEAAA